MIVRSPISQELAVALSSSDALLRFERDFAEALWKAEVAEMKRIEDELINGKVGGSVPRGLMDGRQR